MDGNGTEYYYWNEGSGQTNDWEPTLTYPNSDVPATPTDRYPAATEAYSKPAGLDFTQEGIQNAYAPGNATGHGIYFEGNAADGYILTLNGANVALTQPGRAFNLPASTTVKLRGANTITGATSGLFALGPLTVEGEAGGSLTVENSQWGVNAPGSSSDSPVTPGTPITGDVALTDAVLTMRNCTQGGVHTDGRNLTVNGCEITVTSADGTGSGIYAKGNGSRAGFTNTKLTMDHVGHMFHALTSVSLTGCTVTGTQAKDGFSVLGPEPLTIQGGSVNITVTETPTYNALSGKYGLVIRDADVTVDGGGFGAAGVKSDFGSVSITGGATSIRNTGTAVSIEPAYEGRDNTITLGGAVTVSGVSAAFAEEPAGSAGGSVVFQSAAPLTPGGGTVAAGTYSWSAADGWKWTYTGGGTEPQEPPVAAATESYSGPALNFNAGTAPDNAALAKYGVHWDGTGKVLTLNRANITVTTGASLTSGCAAYAGIVLPSGSTVRLAGESRVAYAYTFVADEPQHQWAPVHAAVMELGRDGLVITSFDPASPGSLAITAQATAGGLPAQRTMAVGTHMGSLTVRDCALTAGGREFGLGVGTGSDVLDVAVILDHAAVTIDASQWAMSGLSDSNGTFSAKGSVDVRNGSTVTLKGAGTPSGTPFASDGASTYVLEKAMALGGGPLAAGSYHYVNGGFVPVGAEDKVAFMANGVTVASMAPDGLTAIEDEPTKTGYVFGGWFKAVSGEAVTTDANGDYVLDRDKAAFTGIECRPKYDSAAAGEVYHALWAKAVIAGALVTNTTANSVTCYARDLNAPYLKTALAAAHALTGGVRMKLLCDQSYDGTKKGTGSDYALVGYNGVLYVTKPMTLDLNGRSIAWSDGRYTRSAITIRVEGTGSEPVRVENSSFADAVLNGGTGYAVMVSCQKGAVVDTIRDLTVSGKVEVYGTVGRIENCAVANAKGEGLTLGQSGAVRALAGCGITGVAAAIRNWGTLLVESGRFKRTSTAAGDVLAFGSATANGCYRFPAGKTFSAAPGADGFCTLADGFTVTYLGPDGATVVEQDFCPTGTKAAYSGKTPEKYDGENFYAFSGWGTSAGAAETVDPGGLTADADLYPVFAVTSRPYVAQITDGTQYRTVQAAVDAIAASTEKTGTITMLADSQEVMKDNPIGQETYTIYSGVCVPMGCTVVLDLAGHSLSANEVLQSPLDVQGTLTLRDASSDSSGTVTVLQPANPEGSSGGNGIYCAEGSMLTLEGGNVVSGVGTAVDFAGAALTISGGRLTGTNVLRLKTGAGTADITGGDFHATDGYAIENSGGAGVTIGGGRFKSDRYESPFRGTVAYAPDKALSTGPDREGYHYVIATQTVAPGGVVSDDNSRLTVEVPVDTVITAGAEVTVEAGPPDTVPGLVPQNEVTLPTQVVQQADSAAGLTVKTDAGDVRLDQRLLSAVKSGAGDSAVKLTVEKKTAAALPLAMQAAARTAEVILDLSLTAGGQPLDFAGGKAAVRMYASRDAAKTYAVYYIDDRGVRTAVDFTWGYDDARSEAYVELTADHFSVYTLDGVAAYGMEVRSGDKTTVQTGPGSTEERVKTDYNPTDTVTAELYATAAQAATFGSFQFTLDFDSAVLELKELTTALPGTFQQNAGTLAYTYSGDTPVSVGPGGTKIATAAFTVKREISTGAGTVTLKQAEMAQGGGDGVEAPAVTGLTIQLHNHKLTFAPGVNAAFASGAATEAYFKYQQAGLYTDDGYASPFALPVVTAEAGYRPAADTPADPLWGYSSGGPGGDRTMTGAAVAANSWGTDLTLTARTVKTQTVAFAPPVNGTLSSQTALTVDAGTLLADAGLPTATANKGYAFTGWSADGGATMLDPAAHAVNSDMTLTAVFTAQSFGWTETLNRAALSELTGVSGRNRVTYGQNVTFRLAPETGYVLTDVSYQVGAGTPVSLAAENGVYTIPGTAILGNLALEVNTLGYHTVAFQAGPGAAMEPAAAYAKRGEAGLYSTLAKLADAGRAPDFTVPKPAAQAGYRMAADAAGEPLWRDAGNTGYTSAGIAEAVVNGDLTLTAQAVKQWTVTFTAEANGTLEGAASKVVDTGYSLTAGDVPTPKAGAGYVFDAWSAEPVGAVITADAAFAASFKNGTYALTFPAVTGVTFTATGGVTAGLATHGTDVTFTMSVAPGYKVTAVRYAVGSGAAQTLTASSGVYAIPGGVITDAVSVTLESNETVTVTFRAGENGALTGGDGQTQTVDKGTAASSLTMPGTVPDAGFVFDKWTQSPVGATLTADTTFTAGFKHGTYTVAVPQGVTGIGTSATHGTDLTFTPAKAGGLVTGVGCQVGTGGAVKLTANADGSYTIPGGSITGNLTITVTTVDGSLSFVSADAYKAMEAGRQMAVLATASLTGSKYQLADGTDFYWSSKYGAYVKFVADAETAVTLASKITTVTGEAVAVGYTGDLNATGSTTAADGMIINDILHGARKQPTTDLQRFEADVTGDKAVTTEDIQWVLRTAVGLPNG